jgi:hypothetical protein
MARKTIHVTRRQTLIGAAGFTLSLPILPSLLVSTAYGADPQFVRRPRLFWLTTNHGAALESNMFPSPSLLSDTATLFSDHVVRSGPLQAVVERGKAVLSPVLQADALTLSDHRLRSINVIQGLDIPFSIGHHTGGHLGNYARNDALAGAGAAIKDYPTPTVDQLLAWSPAFYPDLGAIRERALVLGPQTISWNYSNPSAGTGTIENVRGTTSSLELFNRIFVPPGASQWQARIPVVDHVLESYKRLRNGNRRLSAADRQRLDDHLDRVGELQRKLGAGIARSCVRETPPSDDTLDHLANDPSAAVQYAQLFNEVVATAFMCGSSRIAAFGIGQDQQFAGYQGDWHNDVAHAWQSADKQALIVTAYQRIFEHVFLDMLRRLDVEEAPGMTYLDNSLLVWSQESGMSTHNAVSLPVVMAGRAAGFLRTGRFIDYRRIGDPRSQFDPQYGGYLLYAGLLYSQFLATVLRAMGMPPVDFERWGYKGYGRPIVDPPDYGILPFAKHYENTSSRYFQTASDVLPFLEA